MSLDLGRILSELSILDRDKRLIPFEPNRAQQKLIRVVEDDYKAGKPSRIIVLKSRQQGISTVSEAILFSTCILQPATNAVVMAHDGDSTESLFDKTRLFYDTFPLKDLFPTRYSSKRQLSLYTNRSQMQVLTASARGAGGQGASAGSGSGRGRTIHSLHISEMAFWPKPLETWTALAQTVPESRGSIVIIESTANGIGNLFEDMWLDAEAGSSDYTPLFFPFHEDPACLPCRGLTCPDDKLGSCELCTNAALGVTPRDDTERDLMKLPGMTLAHLAWRRSTIANKLMGSEDLFRQEYCSTPEESFLTSGVNAFPDAHIKQCFEHLSGRRGKLVRDDTKLGAVRFVEDPRGPLTVYRWPSKDRDWGQYFVGADPCYGVKNGDLAAAQVIRRPQDGHPAEQVAVYHARLNPVAFADELARLAAWYNDAQIAPEVEGPGQALVGRLSVIYPNIWRQTYADKPVGYNQSQVQLGWSTNWRRKSWLVTKLGDFLERGKVVIHDRATYNELRTYTFIGDSEFVRFQPASADDHDDLVMSLGIALLCESTAPQAEGYSPHSKPNVGGPGVIWGAEQEDEVPWG